MVSRLIVNESAGMLHFSVETDGGELCTYGEAPFKNPLISENLEDLRWYLEDYLKTPFGIWEEKGPTIETKLRPWGEALFRALFESEAGAKALDSPLIYPS
jgi:hypothetical protein